MPPLTNVDFPTAVSDDGFSLFGMFIFDNIKNIVNMTVLVPTAKNL